MVRDRSPQAYPGFYSWWSSQGVKVRFSVLPPVITSLIVRVTVGVRRVRF